MAKVIVAIEIPDMDAVDLRTHMERYKDEWFPMGSGTISIDESYLEREPEDDSFFLFEFIEVRD